MWSMCARAKGHQALLLAIMVLVHIEHSHTQDARGSLHSPFKGRLSLQNANIPAAKAGALGKGPLQPAQKAPSPPLLNNLSSPEFHKAMQEAIGEPPGVIDRVQASVEVPFGPAAAHNPLCKPLWEKQRVAVVGNGPLGDADREDIQSSDAIIRFNLLNNMRWGMEPTTIWVTRFSPKADNHSEGYWGIAYLKQREVQHMLASVQSVVLLGGRQASADRLLQMWPMLGQTPKRGVLLPEEPVFNTLSKEMGRVDRVPSSGFVAVRMVQHCSPGADIHLYGSNWSPKNWEGHQMDSEKAIMLELARKKGLTIHATPCDGMRECGDLGDMSNSCHWSVTHRWMCFREGDWRDSTNMLDMDRRLRHDKDRIMQVKALLKKTRLRGLAGVP